MHVAAGSASDRNVERESRHVLHLLEAVGSHEHR